MDICEKQKQKKTLDFYMQTQKLTQMDTAELDTRVEDINHQPLRDEEKPQPLDSWWECVVPPLQRTAWQFLKYNPYHRASWWIRQ